MKYYHCLVPQNIGPNPYTKDCLLPIICKSTASLKPVRNVHFPNDIVFQDYVRQGELERIGLFLRSKRVSLDTIYTSGMSAIHEAVLSGNLDTVKLLVSYGADIHQKDEEGWTPLHMACSDNYPHIARYLLSLGADHEIENDCGEKPADLIDSDSKELLELFCLSEND